MECVKDIKAANYENAPNLGDPELFGRPNSYTISKAIAECMVVEEFSHLPVTICRPSIVTHAYKEPVNGTSCFGGFDLVELNDSLARLV